MALFNKVGSILKQSAFQNSSMLNSVRFMSSKVFVGGLSWGIDDNTLREAFSQYGEVTEAKVVTDRQTGKSRGFGFVTFTDSDSANNALGMDGQDLHGRNVRVNIAEERPRSSGYSGGGYGGGGFSGGGYGGGGGGGYSGGGGGGYSGGGGGGYSGGGGGYQGNSGFGGGNGGGYQGNSGFGGGNGGY